jgi:hypothetical protein
MNRREFLCATVSAGAVLSVGVSARAIASWAAASPIKIGHREGNMLRTSSPGVYELASKIPGLSGIEVQTTRSNLWDRDTVLAYKRESHRWNIRTISMGGSLPAGGTLLEPGSCEASLRKTIHAGEILGANVVLVPGFRETCPKMDDESSYGPVVQLLKTLAGGRGCGRPARRAWCTTVKASKASRCWERPSCRCTSRTIAIR